MPEKYDGDPDDPVKIYSTIDAVIPKIGSVLHNKKSNAMFQLMSKNPGLEFYLKEMAVTIENHHNPKLPIYEHHIRILVDSGIVKFRVKMHNKHKTKFYRMAPVLMIVAPNLHERAITSKTLKNIFRQVFKLGAIGIVGVSTWFSSKLALLNNTSDFPYPDFFYDSTINDILPFVLAIIAIVSVTLLFFKKRKR